jgi:hypothetical protein
MEKTRQGWDEREKRCAVLAMEDREGSGAPVKSERGEVGNAAYPGLGCSNRVIDEVCEVVAELWAWCLSSPSRESKREAGRSEEVEGGVGVVFLSSSWRGWCRGTPRVLERATRRPACHRSPMTKLEDFESEFIRPTDSRFCSSDISQTNPI